LLHDNARPHVAKIVKDMLLALQWKVLSHAAYLPDCAPSDYYLFRLMQLLLINTSNHMKKKNDLMNGLLRRTNILFKFAEFAHYQKSAKKL